MTNNMWARPIYPRNVLSLTFQAMVRHGLERIVKEVKGDVFDEDKVTKQFMHQYGIAHVRGGSYCQMILSREGINSLEKEFKTIDSRCFHCGKGGHFSTKCPVMKNVTSPLPSSKKAKKIPSCKRCGRDGHTVNRCYAKSDADGYSLEDAWSSLDDDVVIYW